MNLLTSKSIIEVWNGGRKMKYKVIVVMSLVAARSWLISCFLVGWRLLSFPWELFAFQHDVLVDPRRIKIGLRCEKGVWKMKIRFSIFFDWSLVVWLVEMFTGWFDQAFLHQFIRGAWGLGFMIFIAFRWERSGWKENIMNMIVFKAYIKHQGQGYFEGYFLWGSWRWYIAFIGPNGAGKSTLLDCLLGDKLVTSGQIYPRIASDEFQLDYTRSYLPQENVLFKN